MLDLHHVAGFSPTPSKPQLSGQSHSRGTLSLPARFAVVFYEACNRGEASLAFNLSSERGCSSVVDTAVTGGNSHWCDPLLAVKEVLHVQSGKLASWNFLPPPQEAGLFLLAS